MKTSLISTRRIIFTPTQDLKDELANTAIQITCYDRNGDVVKRVTSADAGTVEDNEGDENTNTENGGSQNGSQNSGEQGQQGKQNQQNQQSGYALTISKYGTGTSNVKDDSEQTIASGANVASGSNVNISVVPAEGQVPTASINGSSIELTEDNGVYTGSFAMPGQASALVISTGVSGEGGDGGEGLDKD